MILADSGPMVALFVSTDRARPTVRQFITESRELIVMAAPVIAEVAHFIGSRARQRDEAAFLRFIGEGRMPVEHPVQADYLRAAALVEQYADFPLGTVDALIAAMAERLKVTKLLTLDHRHFGAIRPAHCEAFTLVP